MPATDEVTALLEEILTNVVYLDKRYKEVRRAALADRDQERVAKYLNIIRIPLGDAAAAFSDHLLDKDK